MCGTPAPAPKEAVLGPRLAAGKASAAHRRGLPEFAKQLARRPQLLAAALLVLACGLFFLRARSANPPDTMAPAPAIAAPLGELTPLMPAAPEKVAVQPKSANQSPAGPPLHAATAVSTTDDPAELWKRVGKGNTDAEVALARLYLDGKWVTQNCEQARLLLLAAAKKRNRAADQVLSNLYPQHCP